LFTTDGFSAKKYIDKCDVPAILCEADKVIYMNVIAKKYIRKNKATKFTCRTFEKACEFIADLTDVKQNNNDKHKYKFVFNREEYDEQIQYYRLKYYIDDDPKGAYVCFYMNTNDQKKLPTVDSVDMEKLCINQSAGRFYENISSQIVTMQHDVRTAVSLTSLNMQLFSEAIVGLEMYHSKIKYSGFEDWVDKTKGYLKAALEGCYMQNQYLMVLMQLTEREEGTIRLVSRTFNIIEELQNKINYFQCYAQIYDVKLCWEGDTTPCFVNTDRVKIGDIFSNLVQNAIKYTGCKENGEKKVTVSLRTTPKSVFVYIKDTGIGIDEENLKYISNKYFRVQHSKEIAPYGKGLGLYSAYNNACILGGQITCISVINEGSTFAIKIPRGKI